MAVRRTLLLAIASLALSAPAPAAQATPVPKLLCNSFERYGGDRTVITYASPEVRPRKCAIWREGWAHYQALTFVDATWRGWGTARAVGQATATGNMGARAPVTVILTRRREHCGETVYTRVRVAGRRKTWRPDTCALDRSERFCGWRDLASGGWTMGPPDAGAFLRLFGRRMSCRTARWDYGDLHYEDFPPYRPVLAGYTCRELDSGYEYSDVRCRRDGSDAAFRFQTGA
jgi:hypothetical protein